MICESRRVVSVVHLNRSDVLVGDGTVVVEGAVIV
jgi:hypothetical protein